MPATRRPTSRVEPVKLTRNGANSPLEFLALSDSGLACKPGDISEFTALRVQVFRTAHLDRLNSATHILDQLQVIRSVWIQLDDGRGFNRRYP